MPFQIEYNIALKIFSRLYVGISDKKGDEAPLAFATPYEENSAGRKRQETVDGWLKNRRRVKIENSKYVRDENGDLVYEPSNSCTRIIDNVARSGFKVSDDVKRVYWGGGNVVWRIEDPDGWEIEIQSNNLMALIRSVGIQPGGEINGKLIWARDGAINVLIPETSQEYKDAIKAAETVKPKKIIGSSDAVIGRTYRLRNGEFGRYLGKFFVPTQNTVDNVKFVNVNDRSYRVPYEVHGGITFVDKPLEAVLIIRSNSYTAKEQKEIWLYSKAPLIDALDQDEWAEDQVQEVLAHYPALNRTNLSRPLYPLLRNRIEDARPNVRDMTELEYKKHREWLQVYLGSDGREYNTYLCLKRDMYIEIEPARFYVCGGKLNKSTVLFQVEIDDKKYESVSSIYFNNSYWNHSASNNNAKIIEHGSKEEVLSIYDRLYKNRQLKMITFTEK